MEFSKSKSSMLNAITAMSYTIIAGILTLISTQIIISNYGSDFNGLNTSAVQMINILLIMEAGFGMATNIALFKPLSNHDILLLNRVISAARFVYFRIGTYFLVAGTITVFVYTLIIKSSIDKHIILIILMMALFPMAINLLFATKYSVLIQSDQKEYILNLIRIITVIASQSLVIIVCILHLNMLFIGLTTMLGAIINVVIIVIVGKRRYRHLDFSLKPELSLIKGTNDLFVQKLTGVIYSTMPVLVISVSSGTMIASVYGVYNSIILMLRSLLSAILNAPRISFGRLLAEQTRENVKELFFQYEMVVIMMVTPVLVTYMTLILPFVRLYTIYISDIDYNDSFIAIMLAITFYVEIIHIPSGNLLNMAGLFKISKQIQLIALSVLIIGLIVGMRFFGVYGLICAVLLAAIALAFLEIGYIHKIYFKNMITKYLRMLFPSLAISILLVKIEINNIPYINGYKDFFLLGGLLLLVNGIIILLTNMITNKGLTLSVLRRFQTTLL